MKNHAYNNICYAKKVMNQPKRTLMSLHLLAVFSFIPKVVLAHDPSGVVQMLTLFFWFPLALLLLGSIVHGIVKMYRMPRHVSKYYKKINIVISTTAVGVTGYLLLPPIIQFGWYKSVFETGIIMIVLVFGIINYAIACVIHKRAVMWKKSNEGNA